MKFPGEANKKKQEIRSRQHAALMKIPDISGDVKATPAPTDARNWNFKTY